MKKYKDDLDRLKNITKVPSMFINETVKELVDTLQELIDMREQVLMWCSSVLDSDYTICTLPDGVTTDGGYCYHLAKPIFEILKGNEVETNE